MMMDPKREMIKMAAMMFEKHGYHKCSIQDIVEPLGITKGSFYYYFKSKEELLYYIHDDMISYLLEKTDNLLQQKANSEQKLYGIIKNLLDTIHHFKSNVFVFYQEMRYLSPENFQMVKKKRDTYNEMILTMLLEGMEAGTIRKDLDPKIVMLGLFGTINWAYQWYLPEGRLDVDTIVDIFYKMLKDGIIVKS